MTEQVLPVPDIPVQFWVVKRPSGTPMFLLRETVGVIDRWDPGVGDWVSDQEMIDDIYGDNSMDTYAVASASEAEQIKAALTRRSP